MFSRTRNAIAFVFAFGVFLLAHPLYLSLPPFRILALDGVPRAFYIITGLVYLYVALMAYWLNTRGTADFRPVFLASLVGIPVVFGGYVLYQGTDRMHLRFIMMSGSYALFFYPMILGFVIGRAEDSAEYTAVVVAAIIVAFVGGVLMQLAVLERPLPQLGLYVGMVILIGIAVSDGVFGYPLYRLGLSTVR